MIPDALKVKCVGQEQALYFADVLGELIHFVDLDELDVFESLGIANLPHRGPLGPVHVQILLHLG